MTDPQQQQISDPAGQTAASWMAKPLRERLLVDVACEIQVHCARFISGSIQECELLAGIEERTALLEGLLLDIPVRMRLAAAEDALQAHVGPRLQRSIHRTREVLDAQAAHRAGEATQVGN